MHSQKVLKQGVSLFENWCN